jgi:hypothetical protein
MISRYLPASGDPMDCSIRTTEGTEEPQRATEEEGLGQASMLGIDPSDGSEAL